MCVLIPFYCHYLKCIFSLFPHSWFSYNISFCSVLSDGTITWTPQSRRVHGLRKKTGSFIICTKHMGTVGQKLQRIYLAGKWLKSVARLKQIVQISNHIFSLILSCFSNIVNLYNFSNLFFVATFNTILHFLCY